MGGKLTFSMYLKPNNDDKFTQAQRIVTQLKRQLKFQAPPISVASPAALVIQSTTSIASKPQEQQDTETNGGLDEELRLELALPVKLPLEQPISVSESSVFNETPSKASSEQDSSVGKHQILVVEVHEDARKSPESSLFTPVEASNHVTVIEIGGNTVGSTIESSPTWKIAKTESPFITDQEIELQLNIENSEREKIIELLNDAIEKERKSIERLQEILAETTS